MSKKIVYDTLWLKLVVGARQRIDGEPPPRVEWDDVLARKSISKEVADTARNMPEDIESASIAMAHDVQCAWLDFWDIHLSQLVRERADAQNSGVTGNKPDSPGVEIWELGESKYRYEPYPYDLIRATRRVFARFNLEAFLEDRTFSDYRNHLDQEWRSLLEESGDYLRKADAAIDLLDKLTISTATIVGRRVLPLVGAHCEAVSNAMKQIGDIKKAVALARVQAECIEYLRDSGFTARIYEELRVLHTMLQSRWGTWSRRIRKPTLCMFGFALFAAVFCVAISGVMPSEFLPLIIGTSPLVAFGAAYYGGRQKQDASIERVISKLAIFHPEPAQKLPAPTNRLATVLLKLDQITLWLTNRSYGFVATLGRWLRKLYRKADEKVGDALVKRDYRPEPSEVGVAARRYTIWFPERGSRHATNESGDASPKDMANRAYNRIMGGTEQEKSEARQPEERAFLPSIVHVSSWPWRAALFAIFLLFVGVTWWLYSQDLLRTRFSVEGKVTEGTCVISEGRVLWPGPMEVVVWDNKAGAIAVIPRNQVARISRADPSAIPVTPLCQQRLLATTSSPTVLSTTVNVSPQSPSYKGVVVIPFEDDKKKVTCMGEIRGQPSASVRPELVPILVKVSNAFAACKANGGSDYKLPIIDVRGFASSLEFDPGCGVNGDDRNRQLAEARRESVLRAMKSKHGIFDFDVASKKWVAPFATLEPAGAERWASFQHMRDAQAVRDKLSGQASPDREALSRRAEIWFLDLAGCDTFNFPSATR